MDGQMARSHHVRVENNRRRNFIRDWRKHRGLTLEQLAERLHTTHATLSRVERGKMDYNQPLLERLAEELRCDPADLIMRDPFATESLWTIWAGLTPPQRKQLVELAQVLKRTAT